MSSFSDTRSGWRLAAVRLCFAVAGAVGALIAAPARSGESLYGVHWWDYSRPNVGEGPNGGWSVESVVTHSAPWWQADWFRPLYSEVSSARNASIITRVDYDWGQTIPAPDNPDADAWPAFVVENVVGVLGDYSSRWVIGNEPNIVGEGNGWPNGQVTPEAYAATYVRVRNAIKAVRPDDEVLFAPVSPGGVINGVRWKSGEDWLDEAISAVQTIPGGEIDGFAIHAYGSPYLGAAAAAEGFRASYASQLALIDSHQHQAAPVYVTEWARDTSTSGRLDRNEAVTAEFIRLALGGIHEWNQRLGSHNIRGAAWFVYDKDYGGWEGQSLEWWRNAGAPEGSDGDLWTALVSTADLPAGIVGVRPLGDFDRDGDADQADYSLWRQQYGGQEQQADANGDGAVDAADYTRWRDSVGDSALGVSGKTAAAARAPEPSSIAVAGLCGVAACATLGRRRR
ncbi:hypothetical protein [Botrimarina sp.]|uniref:hypothetical protein n=1 Tax=Botrimarina sp. TaxID=2795802 RepID=UPI0032ECFB0E